MRSARNNFWNSRYRCGWIQGSDTRPIAFVRKNMLDRSKGEPTGSKLPASEPPGTILSGDGMEDG